MVNATVENEKVGIKLSDGESFSVPSGQTWKVTVSGGTSTDNLHDGGFNHELNLGNNLQIEDLILVGGQSWQADTEDGLYVGGIVIDS